MTAGPPTDPKVPTVGTAANLVAPLRTGFVAAMGVAVAVFLVSSVVAARGVLVLVLVSLFLAVSLDPVVRTLTSRGLRRGFAVTVVGLAAVGVVAGFLAAAVPPIVAQTRFLLQQGPDLLRQLQAQPGIVGQLTRALPAPGSGQIPVPSGLINGLVGAGTALLGATAGLITVIALTGYFLANLPAIKRAGYRLVPRSRRARVALLTDEILRRVGLYMLGNLFTSLIAGVAMFLFLLAVGVPYPVFLGLLVALGDLIPMVGAPIAGAVVALVALTVSLPVALLVVAFTAVFRLVEDYVIGPRVMRATVEVPPVVTIVAILLGGSLLGIFGALIAIPVAAALDLLFANVVIPHQDAA